MLPRDVAEAEGVRGHVEDEGEEESDCPEVCGCGSLYIGAGNAVSWLDERRRCGMNVEEFEGEGAEGEAEDHEWH